MPENSPTNSLVDRGPSQDREPPRKIVFLGVVAPHEEGSGYSAYTPSGNLLQCRFLDGLRGGGYAVDTILSVRPVAAVELRKDEQSLYGRKRGRILGIHTVYLPFVNHRILKGLSHGTWMLVELFREFSGTPRRRRELLVFNTLPFHGLFIIAAKKLFGFRLAYMIADIESPPGHW